MKLGTLMVLFAVLIMATTVSAEELPGCLETDGGDDWYTMGEVKIVETAESFLDECAEEKDESGAIIYNLVEYNCKADWSVEENKVKCPDGYCEAGACVKVEEEPEELTLEYLLKKIKALEAEIDALKEKLEAKEKKSPCDEPGYSNCIQCCNVVMQECKDKCKEEYAAEPPEKYPECIEGCNIEMQECKKECKPEEELPGEVYEPKCGDGICEDSERTYCSEDCPFGEVYEPTCGDGICEDSERTECFDDCPPGEVYEDLCDGEPDVWATCTDDCPKDCEPCLDMKDDTAAYVACGREECGEEWAECHKGCYEWCTKDCNNECRGIDADLYKSCVGVCQERFPEGRNVYGGIQMKGTINLKNFLNLIIGRVVKER